MQSLGQTSANNISSALSSITGGYSSQPKTQATAGTQSQLQNQQQNQYGGETFYSTANHSSAKSPRGVGGSGLTTGLNKPTTFKMPESKERPESSKTKPPEGYGLKKLVAPGTASSNTKLTGSGMLGSGNRGV